MYKLKPCPFCGNEAAVIEHPTIGIQISTFSVECSRCGAMTATNYVCKLGAIGAWNKRLNENNQKN